MTLQCFFDYSCPYCYLGHHYLEELLPLYPHLQVEWMPCEAHPHPELPMEFSPSEAPPGWWTALGPRCREAGLTLNLPHSPMAHSDLAMELLLCLLEEGAPVQDYHRRVYRAVFVEGESIGDPQVLLRCAESCGVDTALLEQALKTRSYRSKQRALNRLAWGTLRLGAVPSFICGPHRLDSVDGVGIDQQMLRAFLDRCGK